MVSDGGNAAQASATISMPLAAVHFQHHRDNISNRNGRAAVIVSLLCMCLSQAHFESLVRPILVPCIPRPH